MLDLSSILERMPVVLLLLGRFSGFFATAPVFSGRYIPAQVRAALVLYLSVALSPLVPAPAFASVPKASWMMLTEVLLGATTGYALSLIFLAVQVAGQVADMEMGFGMTNVLDPVYGVPIPLMGSFEYLLSLLLFLGMDGHHFLFTAIVRSFDSVPAGRAVPDPGVASGIVSRMAEAFRLGVELSMPVLVSMFITTCAMGLVARTVPQINVFMMGLPVRIVLGGAIVAMSLPAFANLATGAFRQSFGWTRWLFEVFSP
jgi:flagellar biosynthetic protein FliR